jgi:hypothetical protein
MAARPKADLGDLAVPKQEPAAVSAPAPAGHDAKTYAHTLSLRLTAEQYRRLRRYVARQEESTLRRMTHQGIIETALTEFLDRQGG